MCPLSTSFAFYNLTFDLSNAGVAKLVDAQDLKSCFPQGECRFDSGPRHVHLVRYRALSSVWLERFLDMEEVTGSNPVEPTRKESVPISVLSSVMQHGLSIEIGCTPIFFILFYAQH